MTETEIKLQNVIEYLQDLEEQGEVSVNLEKIEEFIDAVIEEDQISRKEDAILNFLDRVARTAKEDREFAEAKDTIVDMLNNVTITG
jgi:hypothetical protein